jgi:NADH-quinone oxidoreductase subunit C
MLQGFWPRLGVLGDLPEVTVDPSDILGVCRLAKDQPELDFKLLLCLTCVDYLDRIQLVYFLHSLNHEQTRVVKTEVPSDSLHLPTVTTVWQAADWYEREAHDLFGVEFDGHPDLAPLLLYNEFEGYPGRKEHPFYEYQEF